MAGIMKTVRLARQAFIMEWMQANPGPSDLFGPTACLAGTWRKDAASAGMVDDFGRAFALEGDSAARALGLAMRHLEIKDLVVRSRLGIEGGGSRLAWRLAPAAQAALDAGVAAATLVKEAPPSSGAPEDAKPGTAVPEAGEVGGDGNLYLAVEVEDGEDRRFHWRGGADAAEAADLMREAGHAPVFVESLKGGRPGYWSLADAESGIAQVEMEA